MSQLSADPKLATVAKRKAWTAARREASRERDAARLRLGEELAAVARLRIPEDRGFLVLPPGSFAGAAPVIAAANELIDSIGEPALVAGRKKKDPMAKGFLPPDAFDLSSPYMRFALSDDIVGAAATYFGVVPVLTTIDVWLSPPADKEKPWNSQLWHLDGEDTTQLKVWIHVSDVGPSSGPLTVVEASASEAFAEEISYDRSVDNRVPDEQVSKLVDSDRLTAIEGPTGTIAFVDTSRCFHMGSRVPPGAAGRRMFMCQYLTPYAFNFTRDHRESAPYRKLASERSSDLESLVLGAG